MQQIKKQNLKKLAKRIKELRLQKSKSLNQFVFNRGGITSATWSRVENGLVDIKFSTLVQISIMLEIKPDELLKDLDLDYSKTDE